MITKIVSFLARIAIGKQLVAGVAWVNNKLSGNRSEIILVIVALIHGLKIAGIIPAETADGVEKSLAALLPITLAEKASKVMATIDKVVPPTDGPK